MAIPALRVGVDHVGMEPATQHAAARAARHLKVVPVRRSDAVNRNDALRIVRRARTTLEGREKRFAHLKRMYD
jgi:hypothetical protein